MRPETSIIIRTRNEEKWLGETLKRLSDQTYQNFEIIIVDSGSTDNTLNIARAHRVTLIEIPSEKFTYPYAINVGIEASNASSYIVILSAHSLPLNSSWLASGLKHFATDQMIAGVYGPVRALPHSTIWDRLFYSATYLLAALMMWPKRYEQIKNNATGVLGFTNAIIRRDLWEKHRIDEQYAGGGEDSAWLHYWLLQGYVVVKDLDFTVLHSHNLGFFAWLKQIKHWRDTRHPHGFSRLEFRNDAAHKE